MTDLQDRGPKARQACSGRVTALCLESRAHRKKRQVEARLGRALKATWKYCLACVPRFLPSSQTSLSGQASGWPLLGQPVALTSLSLGLSHGEGNKLLCNEECRGVVPGSMVTDTACPLPCGQCVLPWYIIS